MKINHFHALMALSALFFVGCFDSSEDSTQQETKPVPGYVSTDPSSWKAWLNLMPGPDGPRLHITGMVTLSASNYDAKLEQIPNERGALNFKLVINQTGDMGAQVITEREVKYSMPHKGVQKSVTIHPPKGDPFTREIEPVH